MFSRFKYSCSFLARNIDLFALAPSSNGFLLSGRWFSSYVFTMNDTVTTNGMAETPLPNGKVRPPFPWWGMDIGGSLTKVIASKYFRFFLLLHPFCSWCISNLRMLLT